MSIMRNMDGQTIGYQNVHNEKYEWSSIGYEMGKLNIWHALKLK